MSFLSGDSIILWAITSHPQIRREVPADYWTMSDFPHLRVIELRGPAEAEELVASLGGVE